MGTTQSGIEVSRLRRINTDSHLKAFADVLFGGVFVVKGLKVVEGKNGLFVDMPQEKGKDGKWYATAHPITKEFREVLSEVVLEAYETGEEA